MSKYLKDNLLHPMSWQAKGGIMESTANSITEMESFTVAMYLPKLPTNTGQGYLYGNQTPKSFSVQFKYTNQGPLAYFVDSEGLTAVLQCLEPCKFYCITFNSGTAIAYADGIKVGELTGLKPTQTVVNAMGQGMRILDVVVDNLRVFNSALTSQQINGLYNYGRCDEVKLGEEWRSRLMNLDFKDPKDWVFTTGASYNETTKEFSIVTAGVAAGISLAYKTTTPIEDNVLSLKTDQISMIEFEAKGSGDLKAVSGSNAIFLIGQYRITLTNNWVKYRVVVKGDGSGNSIQIARYGGALNATIRNVVVSNPKLLNEYLPQNLTTTKWIDSGVSRQDLTALNPSFTEINYQDLTNKKIVADIAPNKVPEFIGQKWLDTSTGIWYQSNGLKINNWLIL